MINVVDELKKALSNNDLDEYLRILQSYLEKKVKGVSNSCKGMIYDWIHNLVKLYTNKKDLKRHIR